MYLSALSLALNRPGAVSLEQVVASLFAAGEQGAWYDPSAANVTWRRNQFIRTEDLNNAYWTNKVRCIINSAAATPPTGLTSADEMECNSAGYAYITRGPANGYGLTSSFTISIYAKRVNRDTFTLDTAGIAPGDATVFTLTGVGSYATGNNNENSDIVPVGNGWYRCSTTRKGSVAASNGIYIGMDAASIGDKVLLTGAQIEQSLTATAYQRIVTPEITYLADVQSQPLLFQDSAGTLPVTEVEQPVGLMLDRRKGLALGSELVTNGGFSSATGWNTSAGAWTISGGTASASGTSSVLSQSATAATANRWYQVAFTITAYTSGSLRFEFGGANGITRSSAGTFTQYVLASNTNFLVMQPTSFVGTIDNISVKLLDGNHAYQTGSTARPVLRARYNLVEYSEQFGQWTNSNLTVSANQAVAPDGTTTAELLYPNTSGNYRWLYRVATFASAIYTSSVYAKASNKTVLIIDSTGTGSSVAYFTLTGSGSYSAPAGYTADIQSVGNGWYRCSLTNSVAATRSYQGVFGVADAVGSPAVTANDTDGIYLWGADLRVGTSAGDYQRIAAATDYATTSTITGQPFRPYLHFVGEDGTGDALQTAALNFTGSDKMTICAGTTRVGASTDAGVIVEFSENWNGNNGSQLFWTGANVNGTGNAFNAASRGTAAASGFQFGFTPTTFAPPTTAVLTAQHDIAGDLTSVRGNGTAGTTGTGDKGSGNWGTYPMHIGRRNDSGATALAYRGYLYGLIVRVAASSAGEVAAVESYMAGKTGVTL